MEELRGKERKATINSTVARFIIARSNFFWLRAVGKSRRVKGDSLK